MQIILTGCFALYSDTLLRHAKLHSDSTKWNQSHVNSGQPPGLEFGRGPDPFPRGDNNGNLVVATHLSSHGPDGPLTATSDSQNTPSNHSETTNSDLGNRLSNAGLHDHSTALGVGYSGVGALHDASSSHSPYQHNVVPTHIQDEQAHLLQNNFPMAMVTGSIPPQSSGNLWEASLLSPGPSWWIGYDFDLEALNTSVSATMDMVEPLFQPQVPFNVVQQIPRPDLPRGLHGQRGRRSMNDVVKKSWFTQLDDTELDEDTNGNGGPATGQMTPAADADRYDIDDNFRARVSLKLKPRTNDDPLPSVRYLVSLPDCNRPCYHSSLRGAPAERLCSDIFYEVQCHFSSHTWPDFPTNSKEFALVAFHMLDRWAACRIQGCSGSRHEDI